MIKQDIVDISIIDEKWFKVAWKKQTSGQLIYLLDRWSVIMKSNDFLTILNHQDPSQNTH